MPAAAVSAQQHPAQAFAFGPKTSNLLFDGSFSCRQAMRLCSHPRQSQPGRQGKQAAPRSLLLEKNQLVCHLRDPGQETASVGLPSGESLFHPAIASFEPFDSDERCSPCRSEDRCDG